MVKCPICGEHLHPLYTSTTDELPFEPTDLYACLSCGYGNNRWISSLQGLVNLITNDQD